MEGSHDLDQKDARSRFIAWFGPGFKKYHSQKKQKELTGQTVRKFFTSSAKL